MNKPPREEKRNRTRKAKEKIYTTAQAHTPHSLNRWAVSLSAATDDPSRSASPSPRLSLPSITCASSSGSSGNSRFSTNPNTAATANPFVMTSTTASSRPCSAWLSPLYVKKNWNHSGTSVAAMPSANDAVRMNRLRRVNGILEMMRTPEMATEEKRKVVIPPRTELGMATRAAANLAKMPIMTRKKQQQ